MHESNEYLLEKPAYPISENFLLSCFFENSLSISISFETIYGPNDWGLKSFLANGIDGNRWTKYIDEAENELRFWKNIFFTLNVDTPPVGRSF